MDGFIFLGVLGIVEFCLVEVGVLGSEVLIVVFGLIEVGMIERDFNFVDR